MKDIDYTALEKNLRHTDSEMYGIWTAFIMFWIFISLGIVTLSANILVYGFIVATSFVLFVWKSWKRRIRSYEKLVDFNE